MPVNVSTPDFQIVKHKVAGRIIRLQNLQPVLDDIRQDFYQIERDWFDSTGGGTWQELSPRYAVWKNKYFPGKPLMRRSDRLYESVTGQRGEFRIRYGELSVYFDAAPYWKLHQKGVPPLPVRRVLSDVIATRKRTWHRWVTAWITNKTRPGE